MPARLPAIVVSGASGTVGRHFLEAARCHYRIFAVARRSQLQAGVPSHPNILWIQADIAEWPALKGAAERIASHGGADFVLHLAAFYDFVHRRHAEYLRTNVLGTRHMLELAKRLAVKRFVFASSTAACRVPRPGEAVTERTPADAGFAYARSKRAGEELTRDYSVHFPCAIVRFAAVFSDWCEYPPLYAFLSTWLSHRWNSRILAGRGLSAVSYIHVSDLNRLLLALLSQSARLPPAEVYLASPDGATSHGELFEAATRLSCGRPSRPICVPACVAALPVLFRDLLGRLSGRRPFEQLWMLRYVDRRLTVDSSRTRAALGWEPRPRFAILHRLLFLVERMKSAPLEWRSRNEAVLRRPGRCPSLEIAGTLGCPSAHLVDRMLGAIEALKVPDRAATSPRELRGSLDLACRLLAGSVQSGDWTLLVRCAREAAEECLAAGLDPAVVRNGVEAASTAIVAALESHPDLAGLGSEIRDDVELPLHMVLDEVEDVFEGQLEPDPPVVGLSG